MSNRSASGVPGAAFQRVSISARAVSWSSSLRMGLMEIELYLGSWKKYSSPLGENSSLQGGPACFFHFPYLSVGRLS